MGRLRKAATSARDSAASPFPGRVKKPGVKLAPAGVTMRELIDEFCGGMQDGHTFKGYLPGGASGGILPASMADMPLDFGTLEKYGCFVGSHAVVILSDKDDIKAVALNLMRFFEDESCGQCTPCRVGTEKAVKLMAQGTVGRGTAERAVDRDARRVDLRPRPGGAESTVSPCSEVFSAMNLSKPLGTLVQARCDDEQRATASDPVISSSSTARRSRRWTARPFGRSPSRLGTEIPHLCYSPEPGYRADGNCRACMVEIEGERVLAASCIRKPTEGMKVKTASDRAKTARQMVFELLVTDQPERATSHDPQSKFWSWADRMGIEVGRFPEREKMPAPDRSHPAMAVNLDACIQCNLCVRACREVQVNDVIGMAGRGHNEKIVFDFDDPMGHSTCVACGECVQACPTGALMPATLVNDKNVRTEFPDREVHSVCPYCGVGCQLTYHIKNDKLFTSPAATARRTRTGSA